LDPGRHTITVEKDGFETKSQELRSTGEVSLTIPLNRIKYSASFLDSFVEGMTNWTSQEQWRVSKGTLIISGPGIGCLKERLYKDFEFRFDLQMINQKGAAWVIRYQDAGNYYLFQLVGPKGDSEVPVIRTFKVQNGHEVLQNAQPVTEDFSDPKRWYQISVEVKDNIITHSINHQDQSPSKLSKLIDPENPIMTGTVGFGTRQNEEFVVSGPHVKVEEASPSQ
jgi:hypothetical protein